MVKPVANIVDQNSFVRFLRGYLPLYTTALAVLWAGVFFLNISGMPGILFTHTSPFSRFWLAFIESIFVLLLGCVGLVIILKVIYKQGVNRQGTSSEEAFPLAFIKTSSSFSVAIDKDGLTRMMNEAMLTELGYTKEEILYTDYLNTFVPERERTKVASVFKAIMGKDAPVVSQNYIVAKDGHEVLVHWNGRPFYKENGELDFFFGTGIDITEWKKTEEALAASESRYRLYAENMRDVLWVLDNNLHFVYISPSVESSSGYSVQEAFHVPLEKVFTPTSYRRVIRIIEDIKGRLERGEHIDPQTSLTMELEQVCKDGSTRWTEVIASLLRDDSGNHVGYLGIVRDIKQRKQTEEALRQSEEKYRNILESIEEGYFEVDLDGIFIFFNDSLCRILGSAREELLGMNYGSFVNEEHAREIYKTFNSVLKTGMDLESAEWEFTRKSDGRKIFIESSVSRILSKNGVCTGFRGIVRDVTTRVKSEKALMESEQRYRLLAEHANDIIWTADLNYNFTYVSPWVKHVARTTVEDMMKFNIRHVMNKETFEKIQNDYKEILIRIRQGEQSVDTVRRYEFEHRRGDGSIFWAGTIASILFDNNGDPIGFVGITRDITERIKAEEEIKKNEAKYRTILESIQEGYYEVDLKGNFTFFNDSVCRISGYSPAEIIGSNYCTCTNEDTARKIYQLFHKVFLTGNPDKGFDWQVLSKNGSKIDIESSVTLMQDEQGNPIGFRGLIRDITERKQAEEHLRLSREQLRNLHIHTQELREQERARVAREIHDELGQVLTALKMDLSYLSRKLPREQGALQVKAGNMIKSIDASIESVRRIIMDLRPGLLDHLGLVPAIEWQAEEFSKRTGIECSMDISPQEISLDRVNSTTIFRIFQEALTNIARHAQAAMVEISLSVQDAHLTLRIHDNGIGITKNQIDNPRSFGLMGMRERSLFCNGSFSVFTEETGGTTVIVDIPLSEARKIDDTGTGN